MTVFRKNEKDRDRSMRLLQKKGDNGKVFLKLIKGNGEEKRKKNKREEKACREMLGRHIQMMNEGPTDSTLTYGGYCYLPTRTLGITDSGEQVN